MRVRGCDRHTQSVPVTDAYTDLDQDLFNLRAACATAPPPCKHAAATPRLRYPSMRLTHRTSHMPAHPGALIPRRAGRRSRRAGAPPCRAPASARSTPVATHGAWTQQCTEGKVHGVGVHHVYPCSPRASAGPASTRPPVSHMVHGISSAPSGRCTVWECTMCGPGDHPVLEHERRVAVEREPRARLHLLLELLGRPEGQSQTATELG